MFDVLSLHEEPDKSIILQTRRGRNVANAIDPAPRYDQIQKYQRLLGRHPFWVERLGPTGGYNCVGHVWASRRTGIYDEPQLRVIFDDDGYRKVDHPNEPIHPGDMATYWEPGPPKSFIHMGLIVELRQVQGLRMSIPWVLSKLDATSGEVLHGLTDIEFPGLGFEVTFWTDRP